MQVIGLTGNIGAGKSTVAKAFAALGVPVFNSDEVAKKAYTIPSIQNEVREILGSPKGPLEDPKEGSPKGPLEDPKEDSAKGPLEDPKEDSAKGLIEGPAERVQIDFSKETWKSEIACFIFSNEEKRLRLESLIHAFVQNEFVRWKNLQHSTYIIREAALAHSFRPENCDWLIEVVAEKETRMSRVIKRSGLTEAEFNKRDSLQKRNETFPSNRIFTIKNNERNGILNEILAIHNQLNA
jgi:dephospho-CoA kinase